MHLITPVERGRGGAEHKCLREKGDIKFFSGMVDNDDAREISPSPSGLPILNTDVNVRITRNLTRKF